MANPMGYIREPETRRVMNLLTLIGSAVACGHIDGVEDKEGGRLLRQKREKENIARNIKKTRLEQNKSQREIAVIAGIHRKTYGGYERMQAAFRDSTLDKIATALGTTVEQLKEESK